MKYTNNQKVKEEDRSKENVYGKDRLGDCGSYPADWQICMVSESGEFRAKSTFVT